MWKKLFLQLMPKDLFVSNSVQVNYVQELLRLAYPKSDRSQGHAALQLLGITCTCTTEDGSTRNRQTGLSESSIRKRFVWSNSSRKRKTAESMYTVFAYLLSVHPTLVIVEGLEVSDECSLQLLVRLGALHSRSAIVCTALAPSLTKRSINLYAKRDVVVVDETVFARQYRRLLLDLHGSSLITLENYTPEEINKMLCATLGVRSVPAATSQLVQDFSGMHHADLPMFVVYSQSKIPSSTYTSLFNAGGSYFWVREILQFVKQHGVEHFLAALDESDNATPSAGTSLKLSDVASFIHPPQVTRVSSFSRTNSNMNSRPNSANGASALPGKLVNFTEPSSGEMGGGNSIAEENAVVAPTQKQLGKGVFCVSNILHNFRSCQTSCNNFSANNTIFRNFATHITGRLLLVRFGGLLSEDQRILRKASVIGTSFATSVLFTLLSPHLQARLAECLKTLVQRKWIYQDLTCDDTYQFAHVHVRQLVYELTPPSERNILHQLIADHLSQTYPDDHSRYFSIWYHYQHCDPDKALQYAVKTVAVMVESNDIVEYVDCIELLFNSVTYCKTIYDIYVLQLLMARVQLRIEQMRLKPRQKSWFSRFSRSNVYAKSNKIVPQNGVRHRDGSVWIDDASFDDEVRSSVRSLHSNHTKNSINNVATKNSATNTTEAAKNNTNHIPHSPDTENGLEHLTKRHLLEQIDRFRNYLCSKSIELSTSKNETPIIINDSNAADSAPSCDFGGSDGPSQWQREFLNIRPCRG